MYVFTRRLSWARHAARMEEGRSAFKILTGKPTGRRPMEKPKRRWEDNVRMDLEEIGINAGNWVDSAQDREYWRALVNAAYYFMSVHKHEYLNMTAVDCRTQVEQITLGGLIWC